MIWEANGKIVKKWCYKWVDDLYAMPSIHCATIHRCRRRWLLMMCPGRFACVFWSKYFTFVNFSFPKTNVFFFSYFYSNWKKTKLAVSRLTHTLCISFTWDCCFLFGMNYHNIFLWAIRLTHSVALTSHVTTRHANHSSGRRFVNWYIE